MNLQEALKILELPSDFNEELLKKQFRKLAAKYHPDVNKEADAEEKSKKLSEAHSFLKEHLEKPKFNNPFNNPFNPSNRVNLNGDFFNFNFSDFTDFIDVENINFNHFNLKEDLFTIDITLEEAIHGCKKTIERKREVLCSECVSVKTPDQKCKFCNDTKIITKLENINLTIPPTTNFNYVDFVNPNAGNYNKLTRRYNSLRIRPIILQHNKFALRKSTIVYKESLKLNLLQLITGDTVKLQTLNGENEVFIPGKKPFIDKELTFLHKGILYAIPVVIEYPEDTSQLVKTLKENYGFSTTMSQP